MQNIHWKTCIDDFMGNISSMGNNSNDLDGERSDSNIDISLTKYMLFFKDVLFSDVFYCTNKIYNFDEISIAIMLRVAMLIHLG